MRIREIVRRGWLEMRSALNTPELPELVKRLKQKGKKGR
jgi:hypothetical protein